MFYWLQWKEHVIACDMDDIRSPIGYSGSGHATRCGWLCSVYPFSSLYWPCESFIPFFPPFVPYLMSIIDHCDRSTQLTLTTGISLDSREKSVKFGTHSAIASDLGERLFFATDGDNARLQIKDVQTSDGGVYRCRVDFFESATRNSRINLTLVGRYFILTNSRILTIISMIRQSTQYIPYPVFPPTHICGHCVKLSHLYRSNTIDQIRNPLLPHYLPYEYTRICHSLGITVWRTCFYSKW